MAKELFANIGCAACHRPTLVVADPTFSVPSQSSFYREELFPGGLDPLAEGVDPVRAVSFDLTRDLPDNVIVGPDGEEVRLGVFASNGRRGGPAVRRPENGTTWARPCGPDRRDRQRARAVWMTRPLWGVGSTDPYLHDGRATTLDEAILAHGGEAAATRAAYVALAEEDRGRLIAFLENLVLFRTLEDEEETEELA